MKYLLAAEWLKLRKRWMMRIVVGLTLVIIALIFWGVGTSSDRINLIPPRGLVPALFFAGSFAAFIWPVVGGSWAGNEYGWGTIGTILSRRPNRIEFTVAALLMLMLAVFLALLLILLLGIVAGGIVAVATGHPFFTTSGLPNGFGTIFVKCFLVAFFVIGFYVLLSYAFGTIFRSSAFGVGAGIGISVAQLIIMGIFFGIGGAWREIGHHFPFAYQNGLITRITAEGTTQSFINPGRDAPGISESLIGLTIYAAILLAVTLYLIRIRDVTV
jgi:hypothetical protein